MRKAFKWLAIIVGGLVGILVLAAAAMYVIGGSKIAETVAIEDEAFVVPSDSATVEHGRYLVAIHACSDCHGDNFAGRVFADVPPFLAVASNLTSGEGGIGASYSDADWERAIRHGVNPEGKGLNPIMPAVLFNHLSDDEVAAMIAYLKTVPPVDNELPRSEVRPFGRVIAATGGLYMASTPVDHDAPHRAEAPAYGPTVEYGAYRYSTICVYCHGERLEGGPHPDPGGPPATPLTQVSEWSQEEFVRTIREGINPSGKELDPVFMPWKSFRHMTDVELEALYRYLSTYSETNEPLAENHDG